jgi:outer membrane protein TolC
MASMYFILKSFLSLLSAACIVSLFFISESWSAPPGAKTQQKRLDHDISKRDPPPVLSQYLVQAAFNNPELEAAFQRWKAALEKIPQVKALPDPKFTFSYFVRSVETRTGPQRAGVGITQAFPWFGKLDLKGDMAVQEANAIKAEYESLKLKIFYQVKNAYYEYAYLGRAIAIAKENVDLLKYLEGVARTKYSAGKTSYPNLMKIQLELEKLKDWLETLYDLKRPLVARLLAAMNMPVASNLPWPHQAIPVMFTRLTNQELLEQLPEHNPRIKRYVYLEAREKAGIALAKKGFYPDVTFGVRTIITDPASNRRVNDSGEDPLIAFFSFNLPIWWNKQQAAVREASARRLSAKNKNVFIKQTLLSDMQLVLYHYRDALRKIDLYKNSLIPKAQQALEVTLEAFRTGVSNSLDLIDAKKTLLEFELSYTRALADQAQRFAALEMLLGKEIPCRIHSSRRQGSVILNEKSLK